MSFPIASEVLPDLVVVFMLYLLCFASEKSALSYQGRCVLSGRTSNCIRVPVLFPFSLDRILSTVFSERVQPYCVREFCRCFSQCRCGFVRPRERQPTNQSINQSVSNSALYYLIFNATSIQRRENVFYLCRRCLSQLERKAGEPYLIKAIVPFGIALIFR